MQFVDLLLQAFGSRSFPRSRNRRIAVARKQLFFLRNEGGNLRFKIFDLFLVLQGFGAYGGNACLKLVKSLLSVDILRPFPKFLVRR